MNTSVEIVPGLVLTDEMFEAAAEGITAHVPDLAPLTRETFTAPSGWTLIPDDNGEAYKAEMVLRNEIESTIKINRWFLPDLRAGARPMPHSHPWTFTSRILMGGYTEDRYTLTGDLVTAEHNVSHYAPTENHVPGDGFYHEVREIHDGMALTLMVCERGRRGRWGYLDVDNGTHQPAISDPLFLGKLRALNPHQN